MTMAILSQRVTFAQRQMDSFFFADVIKWPSIKLSSYKIKEKELFP